MKEIKFECSKPPSTNHIYAFTSKRGFAQSYITKKGKDWFAEAALVLHFSNKERIYFSKEWMKIEIELYTAYHQDTDGIVKPIMDLFQKEGVIDDDYYINELYVKKFKCGRKEEKIKVRLSGQLDNQ